MLLHKLVEKKKARGRALKLADFFKLNILLVSVEKKKARGRALKLFLLFYS